MRHRPVTRAHRCAVNCIVPPHILRRLLDSQSEDIRRVALDTLLATTRLRAERDVIASLGFLPSLAGGKRRTIFDCRNGRNLFLATLVRGESGAKSSDSSVNRAFDGLGQTYGFYKDVLKRNSIDGRGMRLDGYVHFSRSYNNAFWDGRRMIFGDGDGQIFGDFTGSLDVVAHELTHGVTQFTANLEYHNQSGALNESISDVFGSLVKQWTRKQTAATADWLIGAEVFSPSIKGDALRSLKEPGTAYNNSLIGADPQPKHMDNFQQLPDTEDGDWGGVHINSGIPNHAFFLTARFVGGNAWEAPGHIWYESLQASTETTDFQEFADTTFMVAGRLFGPNSAPQQAVRAAWEEVGIRIGISSAAVEARVPARDVDGQAALVAKLDALADQVTTLSADIAELKAGTYAGKGKEVGT
jgi:Zn-dependent metalloprotease